MLMMRFNTTIYNKTKMAVSSQLRLVCNLDSKFRKKEKKESSGYVVMLIPQGNGYMISVLSWTVFIISQWMLWLNFLIVWIRLFIRVWRCRMDIPVCTKRRFNVYNFVHNFGTQSNMNVKMTFWDNFTLRQEKDFVHSINLV